MKQDKIPQWIALALNNNPQCKRAFGDMPQFYTGQSVTKVNNELIKARLPYRVRQSYNDKIQDWDNLAIYELDY